MLLMKKSIQLTFTQKICLASIFFNVRTKKSVNNNNSVNVQKFKISSSGFMCVKYHNNNKKSFSFYRFLLGNVSSIKDILLPQNKQKNHKKKKRDTFCV